MILTFTYMMMMYACTHASFPIWPLIPGLKAFNSTRRVPRSNQRFKDYTAVLRAVLLKLAQAVLEARISGGSREK
jgi:hypothetical protein